MLVTKYFRRGCSAPPRPLRSRATAPSGPLVRHCSDYCMNVETIFRSTYRVVSNRTIVPCRTTSGHCLPLLCQQRVSFARRKSRLENKQSGLSVTRANQRCVRTVGVVLQNPAVGWSFECHSQNVRNHTSNSV